MGGRAGCSRSGPPQGGDAAALAPEDRLLMSVRSHRSDVYDGDAVVVVLGPSSLSFLPYPSFPILPSLSFLPYPSFPTSLSPILLYPPPYGLRVGWKFGGDLRLDAARQVTSLENLPRL